jgi:dTDP-4-amino-4,6-dideoxygalactose transaminase
MNVIPFSPPHIKKEAIDEVVDTLKSGWITTGPKTKLFERKITEYCGNEKTLCVASATFGLELILRWFGVGVGDEVIIPAYTYAATGNVVLHTGAKLVMVDVNKSDFNMNIRSLKEAISPKTKVIIPVDIAGLPVLTDKIYRLLETTDIKQLFKPNSTPQNKLGRILILSDSAHSFGAEYNGGKIGSHVDVSVFSFHAVKNLTTAEGGAIALNLKSNFNSDEVYQNLNMMSLHGQSKDAFAKSNTNSWRYDIVGNGYKGNMTDIQASLGLVALKYYDEETLAVRRSIVMRYQNAFKKYGWAELPIIEDQHRISSYHIYTLRIRGISENQRDKIMQNIFDQGVMTNVHFQPLPMLTAFKNRGFKITDYPISYNNYSREISLPVYQDLSEINVKVIIDSVIEAVNSEQNDN